MTFSRLALSVTLAIAGVAGLGGWADPAAAATTMLPHGAIDRADLGPADTQADAGVVDHPSISADGRYVAFASLADNLGAGGTRKQSQVFVRDRRTRRTVLVSATRTGARGDAGSTAPVISADGRWVAFESYADNLAPGKVVRGVQNIFLRDMRSGTTSMLSSGGDDDSANPSIDADGGRVAFGSRADNLVPDDHDHHSDVFVWDRASNSTHRASLDTVGAELPSSVDAPSISADGNRLAFIVAGTRGGGCQDVYVKDLGTGLLIPASVATASAGGCGHIEDATLSGDGRHVAFSTTWPLSPADHDFSLDVYVRDLLAGTTTLVSGPTGAGGSGGRGDSFGPALSRDGRWVAFTSFAGDLGAAHVARTDSAYLKDMTTGKVQMIAAAPGRPLPTGSSYGAAITPDGAHLAFAASAENIVPIDNNHAADVFVVDRSGAAYPAATTRPTLPEVPPHTTIAVGPVGVVTAGVQRFMLAADTTPVRFQCSFDTHRWRPCGRSLTWRVGPGRHIFRARAVDSVGHVDPSPAARVFRARQQSAQRPKISTV